MTMFRTVAGALTLYAGNPKVAHYSMLLANGEPQDLTGRSFILVVRRATQTEPLVIIDLMVSGDGLYASAPFTADDVNLIYGFGLDYRLSFDVIETTGGASTTRWTGSVNVQPSGIIPGGVAAPPAWIDLPYAEIVADGVIFAFSERGAQGFSVEKRLKDLGDIPEADPALMRDKIREWGGEGGAPFAETAEAKAGEAVAAAQDAEASRIASELAKDQAEVSAQTALFGNIYADYETGLAATDIGEQWVSYGPAGSYATRWLKTAADEATAVDAYPSKSVFDAVANALDTTTIGALAIDPDGLAIGGTLDDGALIGERLRLANLDIHPAEDPYLNQIDPDGLIGWTNDPAFTRTFTAQEGVDLDMLQEAIDLTSDADAGTDPDGLANWHANAEGMTVSGLNLRVGDLTLSPGTTDSLLLTDPDGLVVFDSGDIPASTTSGSSEAAYAARDAANVAYAAAGANDLMPMVQQIEQGKVCVILPYGQSLRRSSRGYPPLTTSQPDYSDIHVYAVGEACRPADDDDTVYAAVTSTALYPLLAVSHNNAGTILDHAALEALGPDTAVPGESISISATYWLRQQWLAKMGFAEDSTTPFVVLDCGVGGKSISELAKGASPEYFNRITSGLTQLRDLPALAGKEFIVILVDIGQGEEDYKDGAGGVDPDVASYQAGVVTVVDQIYAEALAIFGNNQKRPAAFIAQAGGAFTTDGTNLHVGQAQLNLVTQVDGYFPTGPNYPVVNVASAHPDNNGYRWLGQYCGRAWSQVLVHGRRPNIVYPRRATWEAATGEIIIDLCSTGGPVVAGQPWDGFVQTDLENFGISAKVGAAVVALDNVRLVGAMTIAATPATPLSAAPLVQFGTKANSNGYIGLRCPSQDVASEVYTFIEDAGQDPAANIPALIGQPYNLDDWCWAASIQALIPPSLSDLSSEIDALKQSVTVEDGDSAAIALADMDGRVYFDVLPDRTARAGSLEVDRHVAINGALVEEQDGEIQTPLIRAMESLGVANYTFEEFVDDGTNGEIVVVDPDNKVIAIIGGGDADDGSSEILAARGSRTSLDQRLSTALTPYGAPKQAIYGDWLLRETRHAIGMIEAGLVSQLPMLWIGDSWTDNEKYWLEPLTDQLLALYGDGGAGYTGFAWNAVGGQTTAQAHKNARTAVTVAYTAGITPTWTGTPTPDLGYVTVPAGDKLTIAIPAGNSVSTIFFIGTSGASAQYRWDGGAWTALDLSGSGLLTAVLAGTPSAAATLEIEGVAGSPKIGGVRFKGAGAGVIIDKVAVSGSNLNQWTAVDAAQWQAGVAALAPKFVALTFGTNDQVASTPDGFAANINTMINRVRAAAPLTDILIAVASENALGRVTPMTDYAAAAYRVAVDRGCAFIDWQYFFGATVSEYDWASSRQWLGADGAHPSVNNGGLLMSSVLRRLITTI